MSDSPPTPPPLPRSLPSHPPGRPVFGEDLLPSCPPTPFRALPTSSSSPPPFSPSKPCSRQSSSSDTDLSLTPKTGKDSWPSSRAHPPPPHPPPPSAHCGAAWWFKLLLLFFFRSSFAIIALFSCHPRVFMKYTSFRAPFFVVFSGLVRLLWKRTLKKQKTYSNHNYCGPSVFIQVLLLSKTHPTSDTVPSPCVAMVFK